MTLTDEQLHQFVEQVKNLGSINFPDVARGLSLNWFTEVRPHLKTNATFLAAMQEALETLKYELYDCLLRTGRDGKKKNGRDPEITYINAVIKHIDSGALLGLDKGGSDRGGLSPEEEKEHLKRMGLVDE